MNRRLLTTSEKDYLSCVADSLTHITAVEREHTDRAVLIFKLWLYGRTQVSISKEFGVSGTMVWWILKVTNRSIERQSRSLEMELL